MQITRRYHPRHERCGDLKRVDWMHWQVWPAPRGGRTPRDGRDTSLLRLCCFGNSLRGKQTAAGFTVANQPLMDSTSGNGRIHHDPASTGIRHC
jgi:hypothetical protein